MAGARIPQTITVPCQACKQPVRRANGALYRKHRVDAGIGLREAARQIGISAAYLSDMERGRRYVSEAVMEFDDKLRHHDDERAE